MGEIIFKTELIKGAKGDRGEAGQADSIPTDGVIAFQGETVPDGYEETDPGDVFDEVYEDINAVKDMISDEYDTTATYNAGDFCIHENALYKCTAAATGLWDSSKWALTSASDETKTNAAAIEAITEVYGAKNLLPLKLSDIKSYTGNPGTWDGDSYTENGVTLSFTTDASGYVVDILSSGISTAGFSFTFQRNVYGFERYSGMILNGCPQGVSPVALFMLGGSSPYPSYASDSGEGAIIGTIPNGASVWYGISIPNADINMEGLHFKPMIRDARITDSTYVPYAMTNRELTDKVDRGSFSVVADGVKTYADLLSELYILVTPTNFINHSETLVFSIAAYKLRVASFDSANRFYVGISYIDNNYHSIIFGAGLYVDPNACFYGYSDNGIFTDLSNVVPTAGSIFTISL